MKAHFSRNILLALVALAGVAFLMAQTVLPADEKPTPSGANRTENGKEYVVRNPQMQTVRQVAKLAVKSAEIYSVSGKSEIGKPGEYVLVLKGQGFLGASLNPVVHIGKQEFSNTYLNEEMDELYVLISESEWRELGRQRMLGISVQNAGAQNEARDKWGTLAMEDTDWRKKVQSVDSISLKYTEYGVSAQK